MIHCSTIAPSLPFAGERVGVKGAFAAATPKSTRARGALPLTPTLSPRKIGGEGIKKGSAKIGRLSP